MKRIESGALRPLKPLPGELRLQQETWVARGTVRAAITLLWERGLHGHPPRGPESPSTVRRHRHRPEPNTPNVTRQA
ncbi:GntR family transcriptional regulator [Micromonospora sp. HUAS LYJ1]|nr:GntR family transcriptional regulator [Micromonospora sp. HUAS LYJ1]WKU08654.1 GntR family transcriptional regulator [Micromonospora sp. HUAS LYJ1]